MAGVAVVLDADAFVSTQRNAQNKTSTPYKRETYWSERVSQWRQLEPSISADDWETITKRWRDYSGYYDEDNCRFVGFKWYPDERGTLKCTHTITREQCRMILGDIDDDRIKRDLKPYFVVKYLVSFFLSVAHTIAQVLFTSDAVCCCPVAATINVATRLANRVVVVG